MTKVNPTQSIDKVSTPQSQSTSKANQIIKVALPVIVLLGLVGGALYIATGGACLSASYWASIPLKVIGAGIGGFVFISLGSYLLLFKRSSQQGQALSSNGTRQVLPIQGEKSPPMQRRNISNNEGINSQPTKTQEKLTLQQITTMLNSADFNPRDSIAIPILDHDELEQIISTPQEITQLVELLQTSVSIANKVNQNSYILHKRQGELLHRFQEKIGLKNCIQILGLMENVVMIDRFIELNDNPSAFLIQAFNTGLLSSNDDLFPSAKMFFKILIDIADRPKLKEFFNFIKQTENTGILYDILIDHSSAIDAQGLKLKEDKKALRQLRDEVMSAGEHIGSKQHLKNEKDTLILLVEGLSSKILEGLYRMISEQLSTTHSKFMISNKERELQAMLDLLSHHPNSSTLKETYRIPDKIELKEFISQKTEVIEASDQMLRSEAHTIPAFLPMDGNSTIIFHTTRNQPDISSGNSTFVFHGNPGNQPDISSGNSTFVLHANPTNQPYISSGNSTFVVHPESNGLPGPSSWSTTTALQSNLSQSPEGSSQRDGIKKTLSIAKMFPKHATLRKFSSVEDLKKALTAENFDYHGEIANKILKNPQIFDKESLTPNEIQVLVSLLKIRIPKAWKNYRTQNYLLRTGLATLLVRIQNDISSENCIAILEMMDSSMIQAFVERSENSSALLIQAFKKVSLTGAIMKYLLEPSTREEPRLKEFFNYINNSEDGLERLYEILQVNSTINNFQKKRMDQADIELDSLEKKYEIAERDYQEKKGALEQYLDHLINLVSGLSDPVLEQLYLEIQIKLSKEYAPVDLMNMDLELQIITSLLANHPSSTELREKHNIPQDNFLEVLKSADS